MKTAGASQGSGGLDDTVSPVFGRCPVLTLVSVEDQEITGAETLANPSVNQPSGAGIQTAQQVINQGAGVVIAGNFGPNASDVLSQAGVTMIPAEEVTVRQAVEKYPGGEIAAVQRPGTPPPAETMPAWTPGAGRGRGGGRGMGRGRPVDPPGFAPVSPGVQPGRGPWVCPACGCTMPRGSETSRKCPNCGADMN